MARGRGFTTLVAGAVLAAGLTIAQVDAVVALGTLDPETIVTPGIFVDRVVDVGPQGG